MKPLLFCLLLLCYLPSAFSWGSANSPKKMSCIYIVDRNGFSETLSAPDRLKRYENVNFLAPQPYEEVMRVYQRDRLGNVLSIRTSYYENGQVKQYLEVNNGRAHGNYFEWHPNGNLKLQAFVIGGEPEFQNQCEAGWLFDGCTYAWDEEEKLITEIPYEKGVQQGIATYYHKNGSLWKYVPYTDNEVHGIAYIYLSDQTLLQYSEFERGERHGKTVRYWSPTQISAQEVYSRGYLHNGIYYDFNGDVISSVIEGNGFRAVFGRNFVSELHQIQNGLPYGEVQYFNPQGDLIRKFYVNQEGLKHGEDTQYYENGLPGTKEISLFWINGKIEGEVRTWYPNGQIESKKEVHGNKKQGIYTAWYRDGNLMMIEDYDREALKKGEYYKKGIKTPVSRVIKGGGTATIYDPDGNFLNKVVYKNGKPEK